MYKKIVSIFISCMFIMNFVGCTKKEEKQQETGITNVTVCKVKKGDIHETINYTGEVKAASSASVSAKVSANVKKLHVEIGDFVNAGDILMTLDSTQYSLAYKQASAAYNSALAAQSSAEASYNNVTGGSLEQSKISMEQAVTNAQSAYDTALDNYTRQKSLYDIGAVSKVSLDSAETSLKNAKIALDAAKANAELNESVVIPQTQLGAVAGVNQASAGVKQARVAMEIAANNLANCTITSPISGYISSSNFTIGQMASPGVEAFSIKNSETLDIELSVTESVINSIKQGSKASVSVKSANDKNVEGYVSVISEAKNEMTGMFIVKVTIPNEDGDIKTGMMADVLLSTNTAEDVLTVDYNALILENGNHYVYVAEDNKARKKEVTIGISDGKKAEILSGLNKGENVVVEGKEFLSKQNNRIRITK